MEMQTCAACGKKFDFDTAGLGSSHGGYVCGSRCAKRLAAVRGHHFAIHDKTDAITNTDAPQLKKYVRSH